MKKGTGNKTEKKISCAAKIFFAILLVCVIVEKILSPSGKFALLDAGLGIFYGQLLPPAFLIGITVFWAGFGIWNTRNIVLDCMQGTDTICLEDVTCSLENGYYKNGGSNCYLYGTSGTGEQLRFEIADTEAEWVSDSDKVYVTYYPHTDRVLKIQEVGESENE